MMHRWRFRESGVDFSVYTSHLRSKIVFGVSVETCYRPRRGFTRSILCMRRPAFSVVIVRRHCGTWAVESLGELVFALLALPEKDAFGMLLWQIWKERNAAVWNGTHCPPAETVTASATFFNEWWAARGPNCAQRACYSKLEWR